MTLPLLLGGMVAVLSGALLFTNAVEWAGKRLGLGVGAVGTLLAGVSTALPESVIPAVALLRDDAEGDDVAIGAIIGAPFMLATIALALVGVTALLYRRRRTQGRSLDVHEPTLRRDVLCFVALMAVAIALGVGAPQALRIPAALGLLVAYAVYVVLTVRRGGRVQPDEQLPALIADPTKDDPPSAWAIAVQFVVGLGLIVGGAHVLVDGLIGLAELLGASTLVVALVVAPLATELPEKANSVLWIREGKDSLALGNVTGALVFQSTVPVAMGVALTSWNLEGAAMLAAVIALAGGLVAVWSLHVRGRFSNAAILGWLALFAAFVASVSLSG